MAVNVVIAGGGTGGHLIPNIVIAKLLKTHFKDVQVDQIATQRPVDQFIFDLHEVPNAIYLKTTPFSGQGLIHKLISLVKTTSNTFACLRMFLKRRPKLVIGVGGYSSIPAVLSACVLRIPILLQEQNRVPGLANRILANFAKHVLMGFEDADQFIGSKRLAKKCIYSGNFNLPRLKVSLEHDSKRFPPTLFISGGSQGARALNEAMLETIPALLKSDETLNVIWQCGESWFEHLKSIIKDWPNKDRVKLIDFAHELYPFYCQSTLSICRAGALTVADVISSATPAVFVPFPFAADNHQEQNARWLVDKDASIMIKQNKEGWETDLNTSIHTYLKNPEKLNAFQNRLADIRGHLPSDDVLFSTVRNYL